MTDTRKAQLEIGVNAGPAEEGFKRVERAAKGMSDGVKKSGEEANKGVEGMGKGSEEAAKKIDRATSSIIASIQRTTAQYEAGEKGSAKYFETLAAQRGLNADVLKPYLDGLRAVEKAQGDVGMSARATAAAMRTVPAQFTDIITSLQGGQAPLTVLLQQGGQLKDMFGGVGNAARALGGYVAGLVNPFTVAAAGAGVLGLTYFQGSKEADNFRKALLLTGNAAGASTSQLAGLAESVSANFGTTVGRAAEAITQLASAGGVGRASLGEFAATAIAAEKAFGIASKDIAKNFADLGKDPTAASLKLNESMNFLTASTFAQIKAAQDLGRTSEAAAIAQNAYNDALKSRSAEVKDNLGTIERAWGGVTSGAKAAWDAMLGVGRPTTIGSQLSDAQKNLEAALAARKNVSSDFNASRVQDAEIAKLKEQVATLTELERIQKRAGDAAAERQAREAAGIKAQQDGLKYLTAEQKMRNEIAQQTATMVTAGFSQVQIEERIAQIRASYAKKDGSKAQEISEYEKLNTRISEFAALQQAAGQAQGKLTEGQRLAVRITEDMATAGAKLSASDRQRLQTSLEAALATEQRVQAEREVAKFINDSIKLQAAAVSQADKTIDSLKKQAVAEREAAASIGLSKEALAELTAAKFDDSAASKERLADIMAEAGEPELLIKKYREEAAALRDLAVAKRERGAAQTADDLSKASAKAADEATRQWQRAADRIEDTITNSLMRGFEAGKGFAENLRDTIKNMFNTMVLRPVIQAVVGGVGGLGGAAASAATGGGSAMSGASSLLGLSGTMSTFGSYLATGFMNTVAGSGFAASLGAASGLASGGAVAGGVGMAAGALLPPIAIAAVVGNVLGLMRSNRTVGGGLMGTLGEGDIQAYDLNRRGGSLLSGPSYSITNQRTSDQSQALQTAFAAMRTATAGMATQLGLANDSIVNFTTRLGKDLIHPDTGGYGIRLDGLNPEQAAAKVQEALQAANEEMAQQLLGVFEMVGGQAARRTMVDAGDGGLYEQFTAAVDPVKTWIAGPFVRANETAAAALQRLSSSLTGVNTVMDTLNQSMLETSLKGADAASALIDLFGGAEGFVTATTAYYQAYYTEAERNEKVTERLTASMGKLGLAVPSTLEGFRLLVEAQDKMTPAGREAYAALVQLAPAFAQVTNAADAATRAILQQREDLQSRLDQAQGNTAAIRARELAALDPSNRALLQRIFLLQDEQAAAQQSVQNTDAALQAVRRAVDAEKQLTQARITAAQEQVASIKSVFSVLDSAVNSLLGNTNSAAQQGQDFITRALGTARTTGYLPDAQDLQSAIAAATSGLSRTVFATAADQEAERLNLAGRLADLRELTGNQLTEAERQLRTSEDQLDALESIFTQAQRQVDVLRGIDATAKTIPEALALLGTSLTTELRAVAAAAAGAASAAAAARQPYSINDTPAERQAKVQAQTGVTLSASDSPLVAAAKVLYQSINGGVSTAAYNAAAAAVGGDIGRALGWDGSREGAEKLRKIYGFANGGMHSGGLRLVGENGPELEVTGPSRIYSAEQTRAMLQSGNTQRLESLVEGLTQEVQRLQDLTRDGTREMRRTADATNGNPEQPMLVSTV
jgi:phage-related minor tail protein